MCNDTLVENPVITEYVFDVMQKIQQSAVEQGLPIEVQKTIPRLEDTFWVNIIAGVIRFRTMLSAGVRIK